MGKQQKITLSILLMNLFIAFLGIGLIIPVLPTLMNELHISGSTVGFLTAAFALTQLIVSPFAGKAADKYGRKIMIVLGLFIFGFSEFLFGFGKTVEVLFVSRILGGVSGAFIMPAVTAFIADITDMTTRPKALGYMSAAISTGFIIGPGIGGFLADIGIRVPFYTAGVLGVVAAILSIVLLSEPDRQEEPMTETAAGKQSSLKKIMMPMFLIAFIVIFVASFGLAAFESFFSLFVDHKFSFTPGDIAIAITGGAILGAICQVVLFDKLIKVMGEISLIRWSLVLSGILVFVLTLVNSYWAIMAVVFTVFIGFDFIRPAVTTYLSRIAGNDQGFVGGMNSFFTSLANVLGPIIGGQLFDIDINYPFYFGAVVVVAGLVITMFWKNPSDKKMSLRVETQKFNG
ncbi:multidrug efflux MFS transporter NorA [Bacillus massiliigorillae]|uniref:multidrug efflux MFS transporter NorA n=1 Tax=Bacillus massiliigorillae TaxID=1243664 RepID=UPI0003A5A67F|nr:multidrug efflux MFS transporter NorA [Bacillus massiliigorillae]